MLSRRKTKGDSMKRFIMLGLLLGAVKIQAASEEQLLEEVIADIKGEKPTNTSTPKPPVAVKPTVKPMKLPPAPKAKPAAKKNLPKKPAVPSAPTAPASPFVASTLNPNVQIINTTINPINVFTAPSLEDGPGEFDQENVGVNGYSSASLSLTSQNQKAIGSQIIDQGIISNSLPINLKTPWAVLDTSMTGGLSFQYLPAVEQNSIIIINPYTVMYTVRVLNKFSEDIRAEEVINNNTETGYMILELQLPARSSIALPVLLNKNIRLHIMYPKNNQSTRINYPTDPGFYVLQELQRELIPRAAFRTGVFVTGSNSERYLYLQQIDA